MRVIKYNYLKSILKNGDICEFKNRSGETYFGFYMDEYIYVHQENKVVCGLGGGEQYIVAVRRPCSMRNAFQLFHDANVYNFNYEQCGKFETVFEEFKYEGDYKPEYQPTPKEMYEEIRKAFLIS